MSQRKRARQRSVIGSAPRARRARKMTTFARKRLPTLAAKYRKGIIRIGRRFYSAGCGGVEGDIPANVGVPFSVRNERQRMGGLLLILALAQVRITVDTDQAPELKDWAEKAKRLCEEWYPKMSEYLATPGFTPRKEVP